MSTAASRVAITAAALALIALVAIPTTARADDPLGFYIGAGSGQAEVRADQTAFGIPLGFSERHTAWKAILGLRPISVVGAELEYIEFGHPRASYTAFGTALAVDAQSKATATFALLYLPLPLPLLDVYAKAGVARLQTTVHAALIPCPFGVLCVPAYSLDTTEQRFAYGAGAQVKLARFALRAEYERVSAPGGNPDLASLALTWSF